jgi:hypothetical protein
MATKQRAVVMYELGHDDHLSAVARPRWARRSRDEIVAHRQTAPESRDWLAKLIGTRALWQSTNQTTGHGSQHSGRARVAIPGDCISSHGATTARAPGPADKHTSSRSRVSNDYRGRHI